MYKVALSSATKVGIGKNDLGQSQKWAGPYKRARLYYYIFYIKAHAARKKPRIKARAARTEHRIKARAELMQN